MTRLKARVRCERTRLRLRYTEQNTASLGFGGTIRKKPLPLLIELGMNGQLPGCLPTANQRRVIFNGITKGCAHLIISSSSVLSQCVGSRPKRVEPSGQLAEHCVETLRSDGETCPDQTAQATQTGPRQDFIVASKPVSKLASVISQLLVLVPSRLRHPNKKS